MTGRLEHDSSSFICISLSDYGPQSMGYPRINYKQLLDSLRPQTETTTLSSLSSSLPSVNITSIPVSVSVSTSLSHTLPSSTSSSLSTPLLNDKDLQSQVIPLNESQEEEEKEKDLQANNSLPLQLLSKSAKRNRYENIIEILEKKYCGATVTNGIESSEEEVEEEKNRATKRKKRETTADYYDMEDPFIDDSENIATVESQIKMKTIQTKHSGYFVNSGVLEVNENRSFSKITDLQLENSIETISQSHPSISSILKGLTFQSKETQESITAKTFPSTILSGFYSLDTLALSCDLDICRLATKSKSPYRVCIDYIIQQLLPNSESDIAEEQMETAFQTLKKQILKNRSNQTTGSSSNSSRLRKVIDEKIPEIAEKIRTKIEPISSSENQKETGSNEESTNGEKSNYQWICKWDMKLRGEIFAIEQLCRQWVEIENLGRGSLSTTEKKKKLPGEELLSLNAEITKVFTQLSSLAFSTPYNETNVEKGGVMGIRKALTTEKMRVKNREKKLFSQFTPPSSLAEETNDSAGQVPEQSQIESRPSVSIQPIVGPKMGEGQGSGQKKDKKRITPVTNPLTVDNSVSSNNSCN